MFCLNCGTQLPDGIKFCPNCGAKVDQQPIQQPAPQPAYTQQPADYQQPAHAAGTSTKKSPVGLIVAAVAVIAIVIIVAVMAIGHIGPFASGGGTGSGASSDASASASSAAASKAVDLAVLAGGDSDEVEAMLEGLYETKIDGMKCYTPDKETASLLNDVNDAMYEKSESIDDLIGDIEKLSPWTVMLASGDNDGMTLDDVKDGTKIDAGIYVAFFAQDDPTAEDVANIVTKVVSADKMYIGKDSGNFEGVGVNDKVAYDIEAMEEDGVYGLRILFHNADTDHAAGLVEELDTTKKSDLEKLYKDLYYKS